MVNFGLNSASLLGIFLAVAGAGLYLLRSARPELSRDHDIFFAAIGLLCGFILLFQGWRLDPILQFGQFLLTGSTIFFAVESIRMRGVATEQAKRNTPIVDDDRPVSRVYEYQAELEELESYDQRPPNRRLTGRSEPRRSRSDDYEGETRSRPQRRTSNDQLGTGERPRKRRPKPESRPPERQEDFWGDRSEDDWNYPQRSEERSEDDWANDSGDVVKKPRRPSGSRPPNSEESTSDIGSRPRKTRRRPPQDPGYDQPRDVEVTPTDYVDFQPIDRPEDE
ncbi:Ycf66 family protein [Crinalium epipsammum PCC 9333]|uniref:Ycf66 family protein n=1 Tax=Crinalium epipsammum PCC 9333 TaxID=1173022 RepID=K9VZE7_9CYAN|nr:Ycf66 family protein [Crinalium epipsammum]AFZ13346.1 Ycf66 family protein [Crinalium epipsammum PCC 9333]